MSPLRSAPVTAECLIVCTALYVICVARTFEEIPYRDAQRHWGAALILQPVPAREGQIEPIHRQLHGPFDVWDGQWWRIFVNGFHHVNVWHLLVNFSSAWILGRRLERRWGSLLYALFLLPAVFVPSLTELLLGNAGVGFSGAICAMLGALMVLQQVHPRDDDLPNEVIHITLGLILLGIPATALEIIPIGNAAHFSGLIYGWVTAWSFCGTGSRVRLVRAGFVAAHLLLVPAVWVVMHPLHNGRYLWYLADRDPRVAPPEREPLLKQAVQVDPSLTGLWLRLASYRMAERNLSAAWNALIEGLSHDPSDADLFEAARSVWRRLPHGPQREAAETELKRVFGDRATVWLQQIRNTRLASVKSATDKSVKPSAPELDPRDFPLDRPLDLHWEPKRLEQEPPPQVDPNRPDSAAEGTVL